MKTLRTGAILESGFEILAAPELEELKALGIWARHQKSGAEVFHVFNDDRENLFAFAFATPPEDSAGAAHILEHSVLCGSERYPLKDAFLVLAQGSLQTFLNAWTFPDKTVYPASSVNEHDYFNLMAVYADAVFRPLLSEWTFMQEGHRLEYLPSGKLSYTGVVYNEMKGVYSSPDAYGRDWFLRSVLPGTPYAYESGGDPDCIPGLTWEGLKEFHRKRYSPANCRIFLAGNIPTEKQLAFLDEGFLSRLERGRAAPAVPRAEAWSSPRSLSVPCPAGAEPRASAFISWLCSDSTDVQESLALAALDEVLLGHDGSPLTRILVESGLGEDLVPFTGLEGELRETVFSAGLKGMRPEDCDGAAARMEDLIFSELRRLVREGIPKTEIEAALLSMEFAHREIRRSGGPYSLVWMRRSLLAWLHGGRPWDSLLFIPAFNALKGRLAADDALFESLIQKYLLDNPHRALVLLKPEAGYLERKEAALAEDLARREAAFSAGERRLLRAKAAKLEKIQAKPDSRRALASIPHLSRRDLSPDLETVARECRDAAGIPVLGHEVFTNGISYGDLAFPLDVLEPGDYPWLPLFSRFVVSLGLPGMDYSETASLLARTTGGFYAALETGSPAPGMPRTAALPSGILDLGGRDWVIFRLKALDEKMGAALDLALRIIAEADFSDLRRIGDLMLEMKSDADSSLAPSGHSYALGRASRFFSRSRGVEEVWNGLDQLEFVHAAAALDTAELSRTLRRIRDTLVSRSGLMVNLTGSREALEGALRRIGENFGRFGAPRPRKAGAMSPFQPSSAAGDKPKPEVYGSPSLQVAFAAAAFPASPFGSREHAAELVLSHWLSTGSLWEDIRMKGGAYGAFSGADGLEGIFSFSTYRDPSPLRSLGVFPALMKEAGKRRPDEESLEKAIIGSFARETHPRTGAEKGYSDFLRFLYGIEDCRRERRLRDLISLSGDDIVRAARRIAACMENPAAGPASVPVIIAGGAEAEKAAEGLGVEPRRLPV
jgi:Zn-dependent M16 (insulinase) family peptidase